MRHLTEIEKNTLYRLIEVDRMLGDKAHQTEDYLEFIGLQSKEK